MADIEIRESGATVTVRQGDRITIRVVENPTSGYRWATGTISGALELQTSEFDAPEGARPGAAGERVIRLRATTPGHGDAEFILRRSWEENAPLDRWRIHVHVIPAG